MTKREVESQNQRLSEAAEELLSSHQALTELEEKNAVLRESQLRSALVASGVRGEGASSVLCSSAGTKGASKLGNVASSACAGNRASDDLTEAELGGTQTVQVSQLQSQCEDLAQQLTQSLRENQQLSQKLRETQRRLLDGGQAELTLQNSRLLVQLADQKKRDTAQFEKELQQLKTENRVAQEFVKENVALRAELESLQQKYEQLRAFVARTRVVQKK